MAAVFDRAGFEAARRAHERRARRAACSSTDFRGLVACGGFSYGDVLGAGEGWAKSILYHAARARRIPAVLRTARHVLRSASATAARCSPRSRRSFPAPRAGRASCATAASSSRGASRWSSSRHRRRSSSPAWTARCCPLRSRTAKAARSSRATPPRRRSRAAAWCRARYVEGDRQVATSYPANPNGSPFGIAGHHQRGRPRDAHHAASRARRSATRRIPGGRMARASTAAGMRMFGNARRWVG